MNRIVGLMPVLSNGQNELAKILTPKQLSLENFRKSVKGTLK